jgi:hypothetical protein
MRIAIAHDFFRSPVLDPVLGSGDRAGRFLATLLGGALNDLGHTLIRASEVRDGRSDVLTGLLGPPDWPLRRETWARLFSAPEGEPVLATLLAPLAEFDLVLGWELPPNALRLLHAQGTRVVDIGIDPIRFAPDLFLRLRTNDPVLAQRLQAEATPDAGLASLAAECRATRPPDAQARPPSVVFVAQTELDASLVADAAIARVRPHLARLGARIGFGERLLLKPHPFGTPHTDLRTLHAAFPDSRVCDEAIYDLLTAPWVERIVTLSSSVAEEAVLFGKPVERLIVPDNHPSRLAPAWSPPARIDARVSTRAFWARVLGETEPDDTGTPPAPLRRGLPQRWGYAGWPPSRPDRTLAPDQEHGFAQGESGGAFCAFGWSTPEDWGVWSEGELATLLFEPVQAPTGLRLTFRLQGFVPPGATPPRCVISLRPCGTRTAIAPGAEPFDIDMLVTAAFCGGRGPIEVAFELEGLTSPAEAGVSDDARRLGVGLRRISARRA